MSDRRRALIIANFDYQDPAFRRLTAPAQDAKELERVLKDPAIGGFEVKTLVNQTAADVNRDVEDFFIFSDPKPDDLLLLYFSGHGITDEEGRLYFATVDTQLVGQKVRGSSALRADFVNDLMSKSRSRRQVLVLDCCHSGAFAERMRLKGGTLPGLETHFQGKGHIVLTASTGMQFSLEGTGESSAQPSVYTRLLVKGLETGEADRGGDGLVDLDELHDYLVDQVRAEAPQQTPTKSGYLEGQLYVARAKVVRPAELPIYLQNALRDPDLLRRQGSLPELEELLKGPHPGLALAARQELIKLRDNDDSARLRRAAAELLAAHSPQPATAAEAQSTAAGNTGVAARLAPDQTAVAEPEEPRPLRAGTGSAVQPSRETIELEAKPQTMPKKKEPSQQVQSKPSRPQPEGVKTPEHVSDLPNALSSPDPSQRQAATIGSGAAKARAGKSASAPPPPPKDIPQLNLGAEQKAAPVSVSGSISGRDIVTASTSPIHTPGLSSWETKSPTTLWKRRVMWVGIAALAMLLGVVWVAMSKQTSTPDEHKTGEPGSQIAANGNSIPATESSKSEGAGSVPAARVQLPQYALQYPMIGHTDEVFGLAFSQDGKLMASAGHDNKVNLWDVAGGKLIATVKQADANAVAFSPDGRLLASGGQYSPVVKLWNTSSWQEAGELGDPNKARFTVGDNSFSFDAVYSLAFSRDGRFLASAQASKLYLYEVASRRLVSGPDVPGPLSAIFSSDNRWLATAGSALGKTVPIKIWDTATWNLSHTLRPTSSPDTIAISPDERYLASGGEDKTVTIWDLSLESKVQTLRPGAGKIRSLVFAPNGRTLACGANGVVVLWETSGWTEVQRLVHNAPAQSIAKGINAVAFSPDGEWLATGGQDRTHVRLWRAQ